MDPIVAEAGLKDIQGEGAMIKAHEALRRDFSEVYFEMYGGQPPPKKIWPVRSATVRFSVNITWDNSCNAYVAKIVEDPEIVGIGYDWDDALLKMKRGYRLQGHIRRLDSVIESLELPEVASHV